MEIALLVVYLVSIGIFCVVGLFCVCADNLFDLMPERVYALPNLFVLVGMSFDHLI